MQRAMIISLLVVFLGGSAMAQTLAADSSKSQNLRDFLDGFEN
ncbi:MAG: hypothetical protein WB660_05415 [Candidatus Sulfotelmatobacter sp.]